MEYYWALARAQWDKLAKLEASRTFYDVDELPNQPVEGHLLDGIKTTTV